MPDKTYSIPKEKTGSVSVRYFLRAYLFLAPFLLVAFFIAHQKTYRHSILSMFLRYEYYFIGACIFLFALFSFFLYSLMRAYIKRYKAEITEDHIITPSFMRQRNGSTLEDIREVVPTQHFLLLMSGRKTLRVHSEVDGLEEIESLFAQHRSNRPPADFSQLIQMLNLVNFVCFALVISFNRHDVAIVAGTAGLACMIINGALILSNDITRFVTGRVAWALIPGIVTMALLMLYRL